MTFKNIPGAVAAERVLPARRAVLDHAVLDHSAALAATSSLYGRVAKRALDVTLVLLSAPVTLPLMLVIALLVMLDGHSPFYLQDRVGRHGRLFRLVKLRSMVPDADALLAAHLAADPLAAAEWESTQKLKCDPRITRMGRLIRKTSLDELPQLWNVLMGHMALVGPRPMMPQQRALYPGQAYFMLRPGITGPWQVSDRNESTFAERAVFDTEYARNLSLKGDMHIMMCTLHVVARCTGY